MSGIKFIHTADLHLDTPFKGLSNIPKKLYEHIQHSTFHAFEEIVNQCILHKVDFLLISGDIFDLEDMSLKAQYFFFNQVNRLHEHKIKTFVIHGNHDPLDKPRAKLQFPESILIFPEDEVNEIDFVKEGKTVAKILGRSYPTKAFKENIVGSYRPSNREVFNIGLLHTNMDGDSNHDPYAPSTLNELQGSDIDYWALGHIHKGGILAKDRPFVAYSGTPQGRHINETGEKGCLLVEVSGKTVVSHQWIPTSNIVFEKIELDISKEKNINELIDSLKDQIEGLIDSYRKPLILRLKLVGKTDLHSHLRQSEMVEEIKQILNESTLNKQHFAWVEGVHVATKANHSIESILEQESFIADFIMELRKLDRNEIKEIYQHEILSDLIRNRGIRTYMDEDHMSDEQVDKMVDEVLNLAIDFFVEEGEA